MSDRYIFRYITILVVIVSVLLSAAAMWLQPYQKRNELNEKRVNILKAAGITDANDNKAEILFQKHCTAKHDGNLPYYVIDDTITVIPMRGNGLWGPIWGYIGLSDDFETVVGAVFDHKSETPGLGAEITTDGFQRQFSGKELQKNGNDYFVEIDAIAGATRTSDGVKSMIKNTLEEYKTIFECNE